MTLQPDGSYWGLHQWFFEKPKCPRNPALGLTTWRVLEDDDYRVLHVCFSDPGSEVQPTIASNGKSLDYDYCFDSERIAELPEPDLDEIISGLPPSSAAGAATGAGGGDAVSKAAGCLLRNRLRIRLRNPENDPLKTVRITFGSGGVRKKAKVRPSRNGFVGTLNLASLPEAPFTVTIRVTTVLGNHLSGKRTYNRCLSKSSAA